MREQKQRSTVSDVGDIPGGGGRRGCFLESIDSVKGTWE